MEKNRLKQLAGLREGTAFKNGKFTLERFDFWFDNFGHEQTDDNPKGNWCKAGDVAKLEELANEMYDALDDIIGEAGFEGLPDSKQDAISAVLNKAKFL